MSSEYFCPPVNLFIYLYFYFHYHYFCFDFNFTPSLPLSTIAIFLFRFVSAEPFTDMKILTETVNQLLPTTAPALESNIHEMGAAGHSDRKS